MNAENIRIHEWTFLTFSFNLKESGELRYQLNQAKIKKEETEKELRVQRAKMSRELELQGQVGASINYNSWESFPASYKQNQKEQKSGGMCRRRERKI